MFNSNRYEIGEQMIKNIEELFTYHSPKGDQPERYQTLRDNAKEFALLIDEKCPDSPEKTTAIRKLQECVMFANASIAINE